MKFTSSIFASSFLCVSTLAFAQSTTSPAPVPPSTAPAPVSPHVLPPNSLVQVTPIDEISSNHMSVGDIVTLASATEVSQDGVVVIPRGAVVKAAVVSRTGKAIGGKSAKFEIEFKTITVRGHDYLLHGLYRQSGRGNTGMAVVGLVLFAPAIVATGHSATMVPGQVVSATTVDAIPSQ